MSDAQPIKQDTVTVLNRLFVKALRGMADAGQVDAACRLAAEGWSTLRHVSPSEAERLNGVLHYFTAKRKASATKPDSQRDSTDQAQK